LEVCVLGQRAVTRVDGDGVRDLGRRDDRRHVQVALLRARRADTHGLVREQDVLQRRVGRRVHGHRLDAELAAGAQNAQRDLAAIGDQNLVEHACPDQVSMMNNAWPNSTGVPFSTRTLTILPATSASIWFIIFMASMTQSVSPGLTWLPISTNGLAPGAGAA